MNNGREQIYSSAKAKGLFRREADKGDPSVGIFEQYWVVEGDFNFQDKEDFEGFKKALKDAWEFVADGRVDVFAMEEEYVY